ncbi:thrombomodulin-like [Pristis pectinata]|uniref:thrombomodulin-like n=1 Tax=Pristis pectinata TaxID=685728 RepID=UPI00223E0610|nr:thrombomodulin-like [Pristis pectinata]
MLFAWVSLCALASLVHSDPQEAKESAPAICVADFCYSLRKEARKFNMARSICRNDGGDAMTVRSTVAAEAIAVLLQSAGADSDSHYWLGLQLHQKACPNNSSRLRGYRWVDGDNDTDYTDWGLVSETCGSRCVAVSAADRWVDRQCNKKAAGVLCEYRYDGSCRPLVPGNGSVTYLTPFGARSSELTELPPGTTALISPWDISFRCNGSQGWVALSPVPWVCQVENGGCEQVCQAGPPPSCSCNPGYRLNEDKRSCRAVDPCEEERCAHSCVLRGGKPLCICNSGYQLEADGKGCTDIDECQSSPCEHDCINSPGGFRCSCRKGYLMSKDGKCEDINECGQSVTVCDHKCGNSPGSYECSCFSGYEPDPDDPRKCVFYCDSETCPARCYGNDCKCPPNYIFDDSNRMCYDINECNTYCQGHECINTPGSFKCECSEGYMLDEDGLSCEPEGSGITPDVINPITKRPTSDTPAKASLSLGVVLGIIFAIALLTLIFAGVGHHLFKKRGKWQTSTKYKSASVEEDVNLSQVTSGEDHKHQYSNDKCNVGT